MERHTLIWNPHPRVFPLWLKYLPTKVFLVLRQFVMEGKKKVVVSYLEIIRKVIVYHVKFLSIVEYELESPHVFFNGEKCAEMWNGKGFVTVSIDFDLSVCHFPSQIVNAHYGTLQVGKLEEKEERKGSFSTESCFSWELCNMSLKLVT